jgi:gluconolactonase
MSQRLVWAAHNPFHVEPPAFLVYHDSFNTILGDNPNLLIAYEDNMPFAHGVAIFSSQRDTVFVTSDKFVPPGHHDKTTMISKLTRKMDGSWTRDEILTFAVLTNGGTNYGNGLLFCAQGDYRDMGGIIHMEADYPHRTTVILNNYLGRRFNSLNDAVVHTDGSMWFTDPMYGFEQGLRPKPELPNQVYRFDPQTGDIRVVADGFGRPKGICFSPQEKIIYIADTDAVRGDGSVDATRPATIYAFDIIEKQHAKWLTNRRVFAMPGTGVPHSIKCDLVGNVYAACGDGLNVWNTSGVLLGKVLVPGGITSFCFGRSGELFLCSGTKFWALTVAPTVTGVLLDKIAIQAGSSMLGDAEERGSNLGYI